MSHKIFLSHNHADKPVVEPVALRLAQIFGEAAVFYDSWSIQPGEGIIDQMNQGLEAPEFVFFFVSAKSLASQMVKLEWQNALFSATRGKTRLIPVRVDGSSMPAVLTQTLYIDMFMIGIEAAIAQIVSITQGNSSFIPQHQEFSNLSFSLKNTDDGSIIITIKASHLLEPNSSFRILTSNSQEEISAAPMVAQMVYSGFSNDGYRCSEGALLNYISYRPNGTMIKPGQPLQIRLVRQKSIPLDLRAIMHEKGPDQWVQIPYSAE